MTVKNPKYKHKNQQGYVLVKSLDHPTAHIKRGYVFEHILVAEKALGKFLPEGAEIHHVNGIKDDNRPSNLVICPDHSYHILLHVRMRAKTACGNANWRKCWICKEYDDSENLRFRNNGGGAGHPECIRVYYRELYSKRKAEKTNGF